MSVGTYSVGRNGSVGSEKTDRIKSFEKQFRFIQNLELEISEKERQLS